MSTFSRPDGRSCDALRDISFEADIAANATGSVLVSFGNTKVICGAMLEKRVPGWMRAQNVTGGWLTAEYSMLPYSTLDRKTRDASRGKQDGRGIEIQRLIGRSLRAVIDLQKLPGHTLWVDCDVLQADGGTRTAAITGGWLAVALALRPLIQAGELAETVLKQQIAAISVGLVDGEIVLDLPYVEDSQAEADVNMVMTSDGAIIEVQGTAEKEPIRSEQFTQMIDLASEGIQSLCKKQQNLIQSVTTS